MLLSVIQIATVMIKTTITISIRNVALNLCKHSMNNTFVVMIVIIIMIIFFTVKVQIEINIIIVSVIVLLTQFKCYFGLLYFSTSCLILRL